MVEGSENPSGGYLCRKCFSTYDRFLALQKSIKENLSNAMDKIPSCAPKRLRLEEASYFSGGALASSSLPDVTSPEIASPDVGVSLF